MQQLQFVKDYQSHDGLRSSFFGLARSIFGISFGKWHQEGFWNERYIPYSWADGDQIIANVSVNVLDLIINGTRKKAVQLGTVMTHPDYRRKGLSASLMNRVLEDYGNKCDIMYLFANDTVLDFYPRFGFRAVEEQLFSVKNAAPHVSPEPGAIRKLDGSRPADLSFIHRFSSGRVPVSKRFGTEHAQGILMYYCMNVFHDDIYFLEDMEVIVVFRKENNRLDLYDVISRKEIRLPDIVEKIADSGIEQIVFHFTPDSTAIDLESTLYQGGLYVRTTGGQPYPAGVKHPATSIA